MQGRKNGLVSTVHACAPIPMIYIFIMLLTQILKYNSAYLASLQAVSHSRQKLLAVQRLIAYSTKFVVHSLTALDSSDPEFLEQLVQWNLSKTDTIGTEPCVHYMEGVLYSEVFGLSPSMMYTSAPDCI